MRIHKRLYFVANVVHIWPSIRLLFGKEDLVMEIYLKGTYLWIHNIFVCGGIDIFVFSYFKWDEVGRYHVSDNFYRGESFRDFF